MKRQLIVSILLLILISCKNELIVDDKTSDYLIIDTSSVNLTCKNNIDKVVYASLFGSYLPNLSIDLNNDSIDDLQFSCSVYHHTIYDEWYASVKTLNDWVEIDMEQHTDLFANYFIKFYSSSANDSITLSYKENFNENKMYPSNLKIDTTINFYPVIHSFGDTISEQCNWKNGSYILKHDNHSTGVMTNVAIGTWREIDKKFIGVRIKENEKLHYAWIELSVSGYGISLYKYACMLIK